MNVTYLAEANWDRLSGTLVDAIKDTLITVSYTHLTLPTIYSV